MTTCLRLALVSSLLSACATISAPPPVPAAPPEPLLAGHWIECFVDQPYDIVRDSMKGFFEVLATKENGAARVEEMLRFFDALDKDAKERWGIRESMESTLRAKLKATTIKAALEQRKARGFQACDKQLSTLAREPSKRRRELANAPPVSEANRRRIGRELPAFSERGRRNFARRMYITDLQGYVYSQFMVAAEPPERQTEARVFLDLQRAALMNEQAFLENEAGTVDDDHLAFELSLPFRLCEPADAESYFEVMTTGPGAIFEQATLDAYYIVTIPHLRAAAGL